jgi:hypothetical protein
MTHRAGLGVSDPGTLSKTAAVFGETGWNAEIHRLRGELTARLPYPDPAKGRGLVPHRNLSRFVECSTLALFR